MSKRNDGAQNFCLRTASTNSLTTIRVSVMIEVKPGNHEGDKADIAVTPNTDFVKIINQTKTVAKDGKKKLTYEREHAKNTITITGTLPITSKGQKEWISVGNRLDMR